MRAFASVSKELEAVSGIWKVIKWLTPWYWFARSARRSRERSQQRQSARVAAPKAKFTSTTAQAASSSPTATPRATQTARPSRTVRPKRRYNPRRVAILAAAVVILIVVAVGSSGPTTRADAVQNVANKIDSGPNWETAGDSAAAGGWIKFSQTDNGNDGGGGCAYVNGHSASKGFACYLQTSEANGSVNYYFAENSSGGDIHPISTQAYNRLVGAG